MTVNDVTRKLDLYNVQRIVPFHQGKIWAESEYGKNFALWFAIPRPTDY